MQTSAGELAAARWLDAEDATVDQALAWALEHDPRRAAARDRPGALVELRGRLAAGYGLLRAAAGHAAAGNDAWCAAHCGWAWRSLRRFRRCGGYFTAVRDASWPAPSPALADALAGRSAALVNVDRIPRGSGARRAVALARELGYPSGEALALANLSLGGLRRRPGKRGGLCPASPADRPCPHTRLDCPAVIA